jgi:hypothetical protein
MTRADRASSRRFIQKRRKRAVMPVHEKLILALEVEQDGRMFSGERAYKPDFVQRPRKSADAR